MKHHARDGRRILLATLSLALSLSTACIDAADQDLGFDTSIESELDGAGAAPEFAEGETGQIDWDFGDGLEVRINYLVAGGKVITGGDMVLGQTDEVRAELDDRVLYGAFESHSAPGWPGDQLNYYIDPGLSADDKKRVEAAVQVWRDRSTFRFVRRYGLIAGVDLVHIKYHSGFLSFYSPKCQSLVGYQGGFQGIWLTEGECSIGTISHELGHTLGLRHEHQRPDRDEHITVDLSGVDWWRKGDYGTAGVAWGDYNYMSVMHYRSSSRIRVNGCTGNSGTNVGGVSCRLRGDWPNEGDSAAILRVNHGPDRRSFRLRNMSTYQCLRPIRGGSVVKAGDTATTSSDCSRSTSLPSWYLSKNVAGKGVIVSKDGRVCLSTEAGISLQQCDPRASIEFGLQSVGRGVYQLKNGNQCLRDIGSLSMTSCADTANQRWKID